MFRANICQVSATLAAIPDASDVSGSFYKAALRAILLNAEAFCIVSQEAKENGSGSPAGSQQVKQQSSRRISNPQGRMKA